MEPNTVVRAAAVELEHEPVPAEQARGGEPTTAAVEIGEFGGLEIGVWEMSPGVMSDIEADEIFVVLSGNATVEFADGTDPLRLGPGDVVRLAAGAEMVGIMSSLFQPFYRSSSPGPARDGLGLGLYIADMIAKAHGGALEVTSDDVRTCFTFEMPLT